MRTSCACPKSFYNDETTRGPLVSVAHCKPCPEGVNCETGGITLQQLPIKEGFWRDSATATNVYECLVKSDCPGGRNRSEYCVESSTGPLCAVCQDNYYRSSANAPCEACPSQGASIGTSIGLLIVCGILFGLLLWVNRKAPDGMLRPFINFVQYMGVILAFKAPWPKFLLKFYSMVQGLNLDVVDVASPACTGFLSSFNARFIMMIVMLLAIVAVLLAFPRIRKFETAAKATDARNQSLRDVFIVLLLLHTTVSGKAFAFFRCHKVEKTSFLMADYRVVCYDATWNGMFVFALLVVLGFSVGIPTAIAYVLHKKRHRLQEPKTRGLLGILYGIYQPKAYYYESINMTFKLLLASTLSFFDHGSEMQLAVALVVNVTHMMIHIYVLPFALKISNQLETAALFLKCALNMCGLAMNYLSVAKKAADITEEKLSAYADQITMLQTISSVCTVAIMGKFAVRFLQLAGAKMLASGRAAAGSVRYRLNSKGRGASRDTELTEMGGGLAAADALSGQNISLDSSLEFACADSPQEDDRIVIIEKRDNFGHDSDADGGNDHEMMENPMLTEMANVASTAIAVNKARRKFLQIKSKSAKTERNKELELLQKQVQDMEESMKGMQSEMSAKREKEESLAEKINDQERRLLLLNEEKERWTEENERWTEEKKRWTEENERLKAKIEMLEVDLTEVKTSKA